MNGELSKTFERISPLCSNLVMSAKIEDIISLQNALRRVDSPAFQMLQEYVIFPFRLILKKDIPEDLRIQCLDCLKFIFDSTSVCTRDLFCDLFVQMIKFVSCSDISQVSRASEELKYAVCDCVSSLILSLSVEIQEYVYNAQFCPALGHSLFVMLGLLKTEKSKSLRLCIIKTVSALTNCSIVRRCDKPEAVNVIAGDRLAAFLPGIVNALWVVICGDPKQGHMITVIALDIWREFIALTLGDCYIRDAGYCKTESHNVNSNAPPTVVRDTFWVKETSEKLEILFRKIVKLVCHDHWKVRYSLTECANIMLLKCTNNLQNCISILLNAIFALSVDTNEQVSSLAKEVVRSFCRHVEKLESSSVLMITEDEVLRLSNQLIKIHLNGEDSEFLNILRTLHGYLQVLGPSIGNVLRSPPHLNRLLLSLLHITEFDCSEVNLLAESSVSLNFSEGGVSHWPKKSFKNFRDPEIVRRVSLICELLGSLSDVHLPVDYLLEKIGKCDEYRKQAMFLIMHVIKGINAEQSGNSDAVVLQNSDSSSLNDNCNIVNLISDIFEEVLLSKYWMLEGSTDVVKSRTLDMDDVNEPTKSLTEINSSIIQVCVLLEAVASFSSVLTLDFRPFLVSVLCPVMEKAGSSNYVVSQTAKTALGVIASTCKYNSIKELILQNSDYLVNSVTINLQQYVHRPESGIVLKVILEHCDIEILSLFRDPIDKLLSVLDYNTEVRQSILQILNSVVVAVKNVTVQNNKCGKTECEELGKTVCNRTLKEVEHVDKTGMPNQSLVFSILEYHHVKLSEDSENISLDNHVEGNSEIGNNYDEDVSVQNCEDTSSQEIVTKPFHVEIVLKILKRCIHLQSSKNNMLCLLSLDTIASGIEALSAFSDDLLPMVHKIWNPLVLRFTPNLTVTMKAFKTLLVIANICGDFVRSRTLRDVLPHLLSFLEQQRPASLGKEESPSYRFTHAFKYQQLLLSEMGHLVKTLDMTENEIESVALSCISYLDKNQPLILQRAACKALEDLSCLSPDAVWFYRNEAFSNDKLVPAPHFSLRAIYFSRYANSNFPQDLHL